MIKKGKDKPTKHIIKLTNGSIIRSLPTGMSGNNIRGYTINGLIADEAAYIDDNVWTSVTPMLMTTNGWLWLVSTPRGKEGYFYERYKDPAFKVFHVNSEQVMKDREISAFWSLGQRDGALAFLESEKKRMSVKQYAQEYLGEFVEDLRRWFSDDLINRSCILTRHSPLPSCHYYLGVDVARMGDDESTFEVIRKDDSEHLVHVESVITVKTRLTETIIKILELNRVFDFKRIYIDDAGVGGGVFHCFLLEDIVKRKIVSINNSKRSLDRDEKQKTGLMKEDLYNNLLILMEQRRVMLLSDDEIKRSLKSVQYEYIIKEGQPTKLRIFGNYTHIVEGLIRACWCAKEKHLNIWCNRSMIG
jgi:hypothetical protein